MTLGIMQSYFFPYLGYFSLIDAVDKMMLYEHVTYRKRTWVNRNRLLNKGTGEPTFITVPVSGIYSNILMRDVQIDQTSGWQKSIKNFLLFNYRKAEYFEEIFQFVSDLLKDNSTSSLHEMNASIIIAISVKLGLTTDITYKHDQYLDLEQKLMSEDDREIPIKLQRIASVCHEEGASIYINPSGGQDLYDPEMFYKLGISLKFILPDSFLYSQFGKYEVPNLSIIDCLMHKGWIDTREAIRKYDFK